MASPNSDVPIGEVLASLRQSLEKRGRVIVSLTLDGVLVSSGGEGSISGKPSRECGLLEVRTADPRLFSSGTLIGLAGHLSNLERTHDEAAAAVAAGEYSKALDRFGEVFTGWEVLIRVIRDVRKVSALNPNEVDVSTVPTDIRLQSLQDALLGFSAILSVKDLLRIDDAARTELRPRLEEWRRVIEELQEDLGTPPKA